jgi:hypothetical protein
MDSIFPCAHQPTPRLLLQSCKIGIENIVVGGSEAQVIIFNCIGRKQTGQSSFDGGSLNKALSRSSAARCLHSFFYASTNDSVDTLDCNT